MYDLKMRRIFLKRTIMGHVWLVDLCVDSIITINNRRLRITEYGDVATNKYFNNSYVKSCIIIKPAGISKMGIILSKLENIGVKIIKLKTTILDLSTSNLLEDDSLSSDLSIVLEVV